MSDHLTIIAQTTHRNLDGTITGGNTIAAATMAATPATADAEQAQDQARYDDWLKEATQNTIEALRDEMEAATLAMLHLVRVTCPDATTVRLTPSDQGDWFSLDSIDCPTHAAQCPALDALADAPDTYPAHLYSGHTQHLTEDLHYTADDQGHTYTITVDAFDRIESGE